MKSLSSLRLVAPFLLLAAAAATGCKNESDPAGTGGGATAGGTTTASTGTGEASGGGDTGGAPGDGGAGGGVGGDTGTSTGSSSDGGGPVEGGWTLLPLLNDITDPDNEIPRRDNDLITSIYFASIDDGYVSTYGDEQTFQNGGALFKTTRDEVTGIKVSSANDVPCLGGSPNFQAVEPAPAGYVLLANGCNTIQSTDGGDTFEAELNSPGGNAFGIERVYAVRYSDDETLMVLDHYLSVSDDVPGPGAIWDDIWAPEANPPSPDPVPEDQCHGAPAFGATPMRQNVWANSDGSHVAYVSSEDEGQAVCVSNDSGRSFFPAYIPGVGEDVQFSAPSGVMFPSADVGIAWFANNIYEGQQWIARSTDGGETWDQVAFPEDIAGTSLELRGGFFAPDGEHAWIVGYDYDHSIPLLLKSSDGGATWTNSGGDLAQIVATTFGGKMHTGFALDANNIWIGGVDGVLMYSNNGGE